MTLPKFTGRLELRHLWFAPFNEFREIVGWLNDPEVVKFSEQRHKNHTLQSQINYYNSFNYGDKYVGIYYDNLLIGTLSAHVDKNNSIANVGIMMGDKTKWGKGFGLEAWSNLCDELFEGGIRKIEAGCMSINYRMIGICQHYGMVEEGRQDKHFMICGTTADLIHWGKFNETG